MTGLVPRTDTRPADPRTALLDRQVVQVDVTAFDARPIIRAYADMSFQARNLAVAAELLDRMLADRDCGVILTLAGSLCSAGLKDVFALMIETITKFE